MFKLNIFLCYQVAQGLMEALDEEAGQDLPGDQEGQVSLEDPGDQGGLASQVNTTAQIYYLWASHMSRKSQEKPFWTFLLIF